MRLGEADHPGPPGPYSSSPSQHNVSKRRAPELEHGTPTKQAKHPTDSKGKDDSVRARREEQLREAALLARKPKQSKNSLPVERKHQSDGDTPTETHAQQKVAQADETKQTLNNPPARASERTTPRRPQ